MAQRGRPRKVRPVEEVAVNEESKAMDTNEAWNEALAREVSPRDNAVLDEKWWKRNKYDDAKELAKVLIKAQGKIHGDTANVVAQLVNDLDRMFPES